MPSSKQHVSFFSPETNMFHRPLPVQFQKLIQLPVFPGKIRENYRGFEQRTYDIWKASTTSREHRNSDMMAYPRISHPIEIRTNLRRLWLPNIEESTNIAMRTNFAINPSPHVLKYKWGTAKFKTPTKPSCLTHSSRRLDENPKSNKIAPQLFRATIQKKKDIHE